MLAIRMNSNRRFALAANCLDSRSHNAVTFDEAGNVIETHDHAGQF
jgi:hypothetical protein